VLPQSQFSIDPAGRILNAIEQLASTIGWEHMPNFFTSKEVVDSSLAIADGNTDLTMYLLRFLQSIHELSAEVERPSGGSEINEQYFAVEPLSIVPKPSSDPITSQGYDRYYSNETARQSKHHNNRVDQNEVKSARRLPLPTAESQQSLEDATIGRGRPAVRQQSLHPMESVRSRSLPAVPTAKLATQQQRRKSLLAKVDDDYLSHKLDHSWQLQTSLKVKLAKWLLETIRISTAARIHFLMGQERGRNKYQFIIVRMNGAPVPNRGAAPLPEVAQESAVDLNMEDYISAIINYDSNLDPYVQQQHNNNSITDKMTDGYKYQLSADELDRISISVALSNEWRNGVFMSELLANAVFKNEDKDFVKQVPQAVYCCRH
jgi:hypothetical protein